MPQRSITGIFLAAVYVKSEVKLYLDVFLPCFLKEISS